MKPITQTQTTDEELGAFLSALDAAAREFGFLINHSGEVYIAEPEDLAYRYHLDTESRLERR